MRTSRSTAFSGTDPLLCPLVTNKAALEAWSLPQRLNGSSSQLFRMRCLERFARLFSPTSLAATPLRHQSANFAPGGSIKMPQAGTTGFEPAISCLTGRCVKPGYTTPPRTTIISYQICLYCSNPYPQRNIQVSLGGLMALPAPVPGVPETTVTLQ